MKSLKNLTNLKAVWVISNQLTSLAGIENLTALEGLYVGDNRLTSLKQIKHLTNLSSLDIKENKVKSLQDIKRLKKLKDLNVCHNKIKKLPDLTEFKKLEIAKCDFSQNYLAESEIRRKLPVRFFKKGNRERKAWVTDQIKFQNIDYRVNFIKPASKNRITKNTVKIVGRTQKGAYVILRLSSADLSVTKKPVKVNSKGIFTLNNLNLKRFAGRELELAVYLEYYYDLERIKTIKFKVKK